MGPAVRIGMFVPHRPLRASPMLEFHWPQFACLLASRVDVNQPYSLSWGLVCRQASSTQRLLAPGFPGPVPGPSLTGGFPGGCGSTPLPTPLLPFSRTSSDPVEANEGSAFNVRMAGVTYTAFFRRSRFDSSILFSFHSIPNTAATIGRPYSNNTMPPAKSNMPISSFMPAPSVR